jgi:hypothetical protein
MTKICWACCIYVKNVSLDRNVAGGEGLAALFVAFFFCFVSQLTDCVAQRCYNGVQF